MLEEGRAACLVAGMDDYIVKPFRQSDVLRTLTRWLNRTTPGPSAERPTIGDTVALFRARRAS